MNNQEKKSLPFKQDEATRNIITCLERVLETAEREGKTIFVGGGMAIEIEAGSIRGDDNLTRNHADLDIHPLEMDLPFWREWFLSQGYTLGTGEGIKDKTKAFVANTKFFYVDVYGFEIDENGFLCCNEAGEHDCWEKTWEQEIVVCDWKGHKVPVMRHEILLSNKNNFAKSLNQSLREKDLHDFNLFGVKPENVVI